MVTFLILVCSLLFIVCFILCSGMVKTNRQLDTICDVLADVKDGNLNRRILAQKAGKIREICYEINEIVEIMQNRIIEQKISEQSYKRLMTGLSHDVKTPLASLIGYLEAIDGRMVKEEKRDRYVNIALMKAIQLKDFTNDLFEWVKLDAKEKVFHFRNNAISKQPPYARAQSKPYPHQEAARIPDAKVVYIPGGRRGKSLRPRLCRHLPILFHLKQARSPARPTRIPAYKRQRAHDDVAHAITGDADPTHNVPLHGRKDSQDAGRRPKGTAGNGKDAENVRATPYRIDRSPNSLGRRYIGFAESFLPSPKQTYLPSRPRKPRFLQPECQQRMVPAHIPASDVSGRADHRRSVTRSRLPGYGSPGYDGAREELCRPVAFLLLRG